MAEQRLQKLLAAAGLASRRGAEELIRAGRVTVNGKPAALGAKADPSRDRIAVDGEPLPGARPKVYFLLHKPKGVISTVRDPQGRPTVLALVPPAREARAYPVGRLDEDSEGLVLLTNDGELTKALLHPSHEVEKEYLADVHRVPTAAELGQLAKGVLVEGRLTAPAAVRLASANPPRLRFILHEGRKRQIRLMCAAVGLRVNRLVRVRLGPLPLSDLAPGAYRPLRNAEVNALRAAAGLGARSSRSEVGSRSGFAASPGTERRRVRGAPRGGPGPARTGRPSKAKPVTPASPPAGAGRAKEPECSAPRLPRGAGTPALGPAGGKRGARPRPAGGSGARAKLAKRPPSDRPTSDRKARPSRGFGRRPPDPGRQ